MSESSSSSSDSSSDSSRDSSPVRESPPTTSSAATSSAASSKKRKSKSKSKSKSRSSSKRSKKEDGKRKSVKQSTEQHSVQPRPGTSKVTAKDIMGTDSDIDDEKTVIGIKDELISYICRRGASGVSKQTNPESHGTQFVDFRLYMCSEIENVTPMNRWRQAIVTLKTKIDENSLAYDYLVKFLKEIKRDFKDCPITYTSTPNQ